MKEWDTGLSIVTEPQIHIHPSILAICNQIQAKFPKKEFSILAKGEITKEGIYVTDDYVIPPQQVTGASVDYDPLGPYQTDGYNVVIHSHHDMGTFFSQTDINYINCHFPCSVLYTKGDFTLATLSFHAGITTFLFKVDKISIMDKVDKEIPDIENIKIKAPPKPKTVKPKPPAPDKAIKEVIRDPGFPDCFQCLYRNTERCLGCYEEESEEIELCFFGRDDEPCVKCNYCSPEVLEERRLVKKLLSGEENA